MAGFDFISFIIGLLLGMILLLLLVWMAYYERWFMFAYCPSQARYCGGADYYNNPGDAITNGSNINDILFLNDSGELVYQRVPRVTTCIPDHGQTVVVKYPQYCSFSDGGTDSVWRETAFNSNVYTSQDGTIGNLTTTGNCQPTPGQTPAMISGTPVIKWEPTAVSD